MRGTALRTSPKKKEGSPPPSLSYAVCLLRRLSQTELTTIVGHAGLAHPVGQAKRAALGAGRGSGSLQLPHGAATLIPTLLGHFTLRNRHGDTSLSYTHCGHADYLLRLIQKLGQLGQTRVDLALASAGAVVEIRAAFGAKAFTVF